MSDEFKAFVVEEYEHGKFRREIKTKKISDLPEGSVLIEVFYSGLNYKDALTSRGHKGITRIYPHTPGVDASGIVVESDDRRFKEGDKVLVTGYDLGMNTDGGFGQYIRVPGDWVVPLPNSLGMRESMIYGTAGFTAGLAIHELIRNGVEAGAGEVLVTGATGGVGSLAVGMLSMIGFNVVASTGKKDKYQYLTELGAKRVIDRSEVDYIGPKPLLEQAWSGVIENVGGNTLSTVLKQTKRRGVVTLIGNVQSDKFNSFVYPFILRGVMLIGIDSAERPMEIRQKIWDLIDRGWKLQNPEKIVKEVGLDEISSEIDEILEGRQFGKILLNLKK